MWHPEATAALAIERRGQRARMGVQTWLEALFGEANVTTTLLAELPPGSVRSQLGGVLGFCGRRISAATGRGWSWCGVSGNCGPQAWQSAGRVTGAATKLDKTSSGDRLPILGSSTPVLFGSVTSAGTVPIRSLCGVPLAGFARNWYRPPGVATIALTVSFLRRGLAISPTTSRPRCRGRLSHAQSLRSRFARVTG